MERRVLHASRDLHPGWSIAVGPALALLYVVALVVGRATRVDGSQVALVWPAAAVAAGWLLWEWRTGALWARATVVTITGLAAAVVPLVDGSPWWLALGAGVGNGLMAVVAVAVFVWLGGPDAHRLRTPRQLWALLLGATAGAVAGAAFVPLALVLLGGEPVEVIAIWVVRNLVSVFVLVACCLRLPRRLPRSLADLAPARWPEVALGGSALVAALTAVVLVDSDRPVAFFVIALAVWAGLRLHTGSSAVVSLVGSLAVVVATVDGAGPFADAPLLVRVVLAQAFMGVVVLVTMALALQRDAQQALAASLGASEGRFRSAFETAPMGMLLAPVTTDGPGPITRVNHDLSAFVGRSPSEIVGTRIERLLDLRDLDAFAAATTTSDAEAPSPRTEVRFRRPDGETAWALVSKTVIRDPDGDTLLCLVEDITARKEAEAALGRHALHDHLTGLPNRTLLVDRLERAIRTGGAARPGVVYLDLDGFKAHNENLGHSGGDELLVRVGSRIAGCVGAIDTVARLGGDEFVVLCEDLVGMSELESVADRIRAALSEPVHVAGAPVQVGASVGLAIADPGADPEAVLREADQAMSAAKQSGRLGSSLVLPEAARAARTMRLVPELERALERDEFEMFGQPVVDLATGRTVAVETLLRWRHPRLGLVPPSEFLDVLENSTLMVEAGARVLAMSMRMARQWIDALGTEAPAVHVNVSGAQLQDGHLSAAVRTAQLAAGVPLSQIVLELTETHAPLIADSLLSDVSDLRRDGVRIALDDLGTGYSSLQRITELPTDILKIDRTFVDGLGSNPRCSAIVRGVLSMSQALGLSVIAEGVETPEQHALLHQHDCDTAQGFLYARPMPADELLATLTGRTSLLPR